MATITDQFSQWTRFTNPHNRMQPYADSCKLSHMLICKRQNINARMSNDIMALKYITAE